MITLCKIILEIILKHEISEKSLREADCGGTREHDTRMTSLAQRDGEVFKWGELPKKTH